MEHTIWKLDLACVNATGPAPIVLKLFVAWIVAEMEYAKMVNAVVILGGVELFVINYHVMQGVRSMDSAKTEHACVHKAGTVDIALCLAVKVDARDMDSVPCKKANIGAFV